jgi:glycosyltransferase involved in cell wall biosynthesis
LGDKIFSLLYSPLELEILENANLITSVSTRVARLIKAFYGFDSKVIGNAVDTDFFVPSKPCHNSKHVLWVGRLIYVKGVFDLVKCAEYVCKEDPSISFSVAGRGPLMKPLKKLVKNRGLEKKLIFVGQLDRANLRRYYQNSAIFVLTSHVESFPTTVLEAMSCGIPVVATMAGDVPKVVKDGKTGFLVPPKDSKAMARRIIYLLNDEGLRKRMGKASRKLVENEYSWNRISDEIIGCYKSVENIR